MDILELVEKVFKKSEERELHINDIVDKAITYSLADISKDNLIQKVSAALAHNVKSKTPLFRKLKNKKGGFRKGIYALKQKREKVAPIEIPQVKTQYTGTAGEFAVLSELLFRGYNASSMSVDDGIDIVASKDNNYFHIQVKTSNENKDGFLATIKKTAFEGKYSGLTFYVIVLRRIINNSFVNNYLVFSAFDIKNLIKKGIIKDKDGLSMKITIENKKYILNKTENVTQHIDDFDGIK